MKIDWNSYGVDADDALFWDRYYAAVKNVSEREQNSKNQKNDAEQIRAYCASFRKFYADLIGEKNAEALLRDTSDNKRCMDNIFESLLCCVYQQKLESKQRMSRILMKYAPKKKQEGQHDTSVV